MAKCDLNTRSSNRSNDSPTLLPSLEDIGLVQSRKDGERVFFTEKVFRRLEDSGRGYRHGYVYGYDCGFRE